jgi:hypothetical protein
VRFCDTPLTKICPPHAPTWRSCSREVPRSPTKYHDSSEACRRAARIAFAASTGVKGPLYGVSFVDDCAFISGPLKHE